MIILYSHFLPHLLLPLTHLQHGTVLMSSAATIKSYGEWSAFSLGLSKSIRDTRNWQKLMPEVHDITQQWRNIQHMKMRFGADTPEGKEMIEMMIDYANKDLDKITKIVALSLLKGEVND
jgi:hypothetical protein